MTKKDYEAIALLVAELSVSPQKSAEILRGFMFYCESDNPRFDRDTFTAAIFMYTNKFLGTTWDETLGIKDSIKFEGHSANA